VVAIVVAAARAVWTIGCADEEETVPLGINPIVTVEKQLLNMIGNLV
jgi:hypothetical protein